MIWFKMAAVLVIVLSATVVLAIAAQTRINRDNGGQE